jgi:hypothetical protein
MEPMDLVEPEGAERPPHAHISLAYSTDQDPYYRGVVALIVDGERVHEYRVRSHKAHEVRIGCQS